MSVSLALSGRFGGKPVIAVAPCTPGTARSLSSRRWYVCRRAGSCCRRLRQRHRERHEPRSIEAAVHLREVVDRAQEQSRADDQHDGQRHFRHDEPAAHVMTRRVGRALGAAFLQRRDQAAHARVHQRREADDDAGHHRHTQRKEQHRQDQRRPRSCVAGSPDTHVSSARMPTRASTRQARRQRATAARLRS